jgi:hypothetical protein
MGHKPTDEQVAILDAFPTGDNLVIEAGAGAGKTSTLKMLAAGNPGKRGLYLAYNRAIKDDAMRTFPGTVTCMTSHGLAYRPVGAKYKRRLNGGRVPAVRAAQILGIREAFKLSADGLMLQPTSLARVAVDTVARFCHSADAEIGLHHVPVINGFETRAERRALAEVVLPYARKAWLDILNETGQLHFTHDAYLKIYQLAGPKLDYDFLLVDEAQDLNAVVKAIVEAQQTQLVFVGDRNQAIYGWRGAVDAMQTADGKRLYLSQSFRFGQAIADEANKWLQVLNADLRLRGFDQINSVVAPLDTPDAVLCRSNAAALARVMRAADKGVRVGLVGGGSEIQALARAAVDLIAGRGTDHPDLMAFRTWAEVQDYAENDAAGSDLKVLVSMVDRHTPEKIIATMELLTDERYAALLVSTAHKAKGREWRRVQIADDFREPKATENDPFPEIDRAEAMLAYVAVTRAQHVLDRDGLEWIDNWTGAGCVTVPAAPEPSPEPELAPAPVTASAPPAVEVTASPVAPDVAEAEFPEGTLVRYRPGVYTNLTVFTVVSSYVSQMAGVRLYQIRQPDGRIQQAIPGDRLIAAFPTQAAVSTEATRGGEGPALAEQASVAEPAPVPLHCRRCGSRRCICGPAELRKFLALAEATTAEAVWAAVDAYRLESGMGSGSRQMALAA